MAIKPRSGAYREVTVSAILLGIVMGALLAACFTYAGLLIGFTIGGSAVAAILGFGILRGVFEKGHHRREQHQPDHRLRDQHHHFWHHLHGARLLPHEPGVRHHPGDGGGDRGGPARYLLHHPHPQADDRSGPSAFSHWHRRGHGAEVAGSRGGEVAPAGAGAADQCRGLLRQPVPGGVRGEAGRWSSLRHRAAADSPYRSTWAPSCTCPATSTASGP